MSIDVERNIDATREKLRWLEEYYEATKKNEDLNPTARKDILLTTKRLINQFKEDIVRFEAGSAVRPEHE
jgi:hypothetical protein